MTTTTHRCVSSGETVELEARWDKHAQWWVTRHKECSDVCMGYHEPEGE